MNDSAQTPKRGRGRPDGSTSFARIKVADLVDLVGMNVSVLVSKKWIENLGLAVEEAKPIVLREAQEIETEQPKIEYNLTPFSDDESDDSNE